MAILTEWYKNGNIESGIIMAMSLHQRIGQDTLSLLLEA